MSCVAPSWEQETRTDSGLAHRARVGDEPAMAELARRFEPLVRQSARRACRALPHEERAVVEAQARGALVLLVRRYDEGRGVPFEGYVYEMLPRHLFNWTCKEQLLLERQTALLEADDVPQAPCWSATGAASEEDLTLWLWWEQALGELPQRQRIVMELVLEGWTECEIAQKLGVSGPAVHQLKSRARKTLQKSY